ncbi:MAG: ABC transporter substrate-binding protein [Dehalococcoidaceae bacterium]|nr:ABC transporter substrate-binding protein [Dehalococcoidaceae bacterium]
MPKLKWPGGLLKVLILSAVLSLTACGSGTTTTVTNTTTATQTATQTTTQTTTKTTPNIKNPNTFIDASLNSVETMDLQLMTSSATTVLSYNAYDSLIASNLEGDLFPALSTSVPTADNSLLTTEDDGGVRIEFPVRQGVLFHNGDVLVPEDVKYTYMRGMIMDKFADITQALTGTGSFAALIEEKGLEAAFAELDNAIAIEGNSVVFYLVQPFSPFLDIISDNGAKFGIMNKSWAVGQGAWPGTLETVEDYMTLTDESNALHDKMMGTGPFMLTSWQPGERVVLERFDDYWQGPAQIERVIRQIVADNNTAIQLLKQGDADFVSLSLPEIQQVEGLDGITVVKDIPTAQLIKINFNFDIKGDKYLGDKQLGSQGTPADFFSDIDVRKGFCYAFDYETFIDEVLLGAGLKPYGPVPIGFPTSNPDTSQYYFSLDKAEEHLRQAFGGELWEKGFKLVVHYNEGSAHRQRAMEILKANLNSINPKFELEIVSLPWASYVGGINDSELPLSVFGILPTNRHPYASLHYHMHSGGFYAGAEGYTDLAVEKYDALIDELASTFDNARIAELSNTLQELSYEDALSIFHYQVIGQVAMRDWVQGYEIQAYPFFINYYPISKGY